MVDAAGTVGEKSGAAGHPDGPGAPRVLPGLQLGTHAGPDLHQQVSLHTDAAGPNPSGTTDPQASVRPSLEEPQNPDVAPAALARPEPTHQDQPQPNLSQGQAAAALLGLGRPSGPQDDGGRPPAAASTAVTDTGAVQADSGGTGFAASPINTTATGAPGASTGAQPGANPANVTAAQAANLILAMIPYVTSGGSPGPANTGAGGVASAPAAAAVAAGAASGADGADTDAAAAANVILAMIPYVTGGAAAGGDAAALDATDARAAAGTTTDTPLAAGSDAADAAAGGSGGGIGSSLGERRRSNGNGTARPRGAAGGGAESDDGGEEDMEDDDDDDEEDEPVLILNRGGDYITGRQAIVAAFPEQVRQRGGDGILYARRSTAGGPGPSGHTGPELQPCLVRVYCHGRVMRLLSVRQLVTHLGVRPRGRLRLSWEGGRPVVERLPPQDPGLLRLKKRCLLDGRALAVPKSVIKYLLGPNTAEVCPGDLSVQVYRAGPAGLPEGDPVGLLLSRARTDSRRTRWVFMVSQEWPAQVKPAVGDLLRFSAVRTPSGRGAGQADHHGHANLAVTVELLRDPDWPPARRKAAGQGGPAPAPKAAEPAGSKRRQGWPGASGSAASRDISDAGKDQAADSDGRDEGEGEQPQHIHQLQEQQQEAAGLGGPVWLEEVMRDTSDRRSSPLGTSKQQQQRQKLEKQPRQRQSQAQRALAAAAASELPGLAQPDVAASAGAGKWASDMAPAGHAQESPGQPVWGRGQESPGRPAWDTASAVDTAVPNRSRAATPPAYQHRMGRGEGCANGPTAQQRQPVPLHLVYQREALLEQLQTAGLVGNGSVGEERPQAAGVIGDGGLGEKRLRTAGRRRTSGLGEERPQATGRRRGGGLGEDQAEADARQEYEDNGRAADNGNYDAAGGGGGGGSGVEEQLQTEELLLRHRELLLQAQLYRELQLGHLRLQRQYEQLQQHLSGRLRGLLVKLTALLRREVAEAGPPASPPLAPAVVGAVGGGKKRGYGGGDSGGLGLPAQTARVAPYRTAASARTALDAAAATGFLARCLEDRDQELLQPPQQQQWQLAADMTDPAAAMALWQTGARGAVPLGQGFPSWGPSQGPASAGAELPASASDGRRVRQRRDGGATAGGPGGGVPGVARPGREGRAGYDPG